MEPIKVNIDEMNADLKQLERTINNFSTYGKKFIQEVRSDMSSFNSDFASQADTLLAFMEDTTAEDLIKKMKQYEQHISDLKETFISADETMAEEMT
ncbi:hypothetical protein [Isobaculum melis]|uniref:Type VII secretion effector, SACOL2603 family n=1 Tax=Isobaculum melis TaxID=142588 RepID=A0A1H9QGY0_9LACT|nr:hypothetical protein [Isobaculum melis]SER59660.1 hypothetical protein SAMN04488559_10264 [Isobaculum melis]